MAVPLPQAGIRGSKGAGATEGSLSVAWDGESFLTWGRECHSEGGDVAAWMGGSAEARQRRWGVAKPAVGMLLCAYAVQGSRWQGGR